MNIGLVTARITQNPVRFSNFDYYLTEIRLNFLHTKSYFAEAIALVDGKTSKSIVEFYSKGDYVLIEGECLIIQDKRQNLSLVIYVTDVQPARLIIQS